MSIALVFRASDGVLVVADGREVLMGGSNDALAWRTDQAVKMVSAEGAPLIATRGGAATRRGTGYTSRCDMATSVLLREDELWH